jgi:hypothetical protein
LVCAKMLLLKLYGSTISSFGPFFGIFIFISMGGLIKQKIIKLKFKLGWKLVEFPWKRIERTLYKLNTYNTYIQHCGPSSKYMQT